MVEDSLLEDYLSMDAALSQIEEIAQTEQPIQEVQNGEISKWYQRAPEYEAEKINSEELHQEPVEENYKPDTIPHFNETSSLKKLSFDP